MYLIRGFFWHAGFTLHPRCVQVFLKVTEQNDTTEDSENKRKKLEDISESELPMHASSPFMIH